MEQTLGSNSRRLILICVLLGAATLATFWPALHNDFISYDDPYYVTKNVNVNAGLTWHGVRWAFTAMHASNWHPLAWLSHALDCELFGLDPRGHHLTNLLLHTANTLLLFLLLRRMTGALWRGAFVAALFAVHPMHVESVAWVSERKDVLSAFFGLLAITSYVRYVRPAEGSGINSQVFYALSLLCFALGLLSKPMLVTLPCVLLLLDLWPLQRIPLVVTPAAWRTARRLIMEKLPFFALVAISCVLTVMAQSKGGSVAPTGDINFLQRLANSVIAYGWYVWKLFWPVDLAIIYPLFPNRPMEQIIYATMLVAGLTTLALWQRRRRPYLFVGWFWYVGMLVPVIGLVQVGMQAYADRYTYLPYVGLFIMLAWAVAELTASWPKRQLLLAVGAVAILAASVGGTRHQLQFWKDEETLFRRARAVTENNYIALNNLGYALASRGQYDEAIELYAESLKAAPRFAEAYNSIGCARLGQKKPELALEAFVQALAIKPEAVIIRNNCGTALHELGRHAEAVEQYQEALRLDPDYAEAHYNLANSYSALKETTNALTHYHRAITLAPAYGNAWLNLGYELLRLGRRTEAKAAFESALGAKNDFVPAHYGLALVANEAGEPGAAATHFREFLKANPDHVAARTQLAMALAAQNQPAEAMTEAREALRRAPDHAPAHYTLAVLLEQDGQTAEAMAHYDDAIRLAPDYPEALNNLAWTLATQRDAKFRDAARAVRHARRACELTQNKIPFFLGTLAAALAEAGEFAEAAATAEKAGELAEAMDDPGLAANNRKFAGWYRTGKNWREGDAGQ